MTIQVGGNTATTAQITQIKTDIGLANVDDTRDSAKPVSTAQAAAIASAVSGKADAAAMATSLAGKADASALAAKQAAIAANDGKLLGAPTTTGGAPVPLTLGAGLSLAAGVLSAPGGSGGSVQIINDLTTGGATSAASAETVKTLQSTKADAAATITVAATGPLTLTKALHSGKRILITAADVTISADSDWAGATAGVAVDVSGAGAYTLTADANLTIPAGAASGSAAALGGSVLLVPVGAALVSLTPAATSAGGYATFNVSPVADVAPNSSVVTAVGDPVILPPIKAGGRIVVRVSGTGTGSGARSLILFFGPNQYSLGGLVTAGGLLADFDATLEIYCPTAASQIATRAQGNGTADGSTAMVTNRIAGTVDTSQPSALRLHVLKATPADVCNIVFCQVEVHQ